MLVMMLVSKLEEVKVCMLARRKVVRLVKELDRSKVHKLVKDLA